MNNQAGYQQENLSEPRAAKVLGISCLTLQRARRKGQISFFRIGRRVLYSQRHVADFLAQSECKKAGD